MTLTETQRTQCEQIVTPKTILCILSEIRPGVVNSQDFINNALQKFVPYSLVSAFSVTSKTAIAESERLNCSREHLDKCIHNQHEIEIGDQLQ
jgi:hypothetical protein